MAVDLVKSHVTMSVVSLPAGMNECPQDSFLHNIALSGLPGVTKVAFLKSMTGNMCKKTSSFNHAAYSYKLTCQRLNRLLLFSSVSFTTEPTID
jgi:hypothetical protein